MTTEDNVYSGQKDRFIGLCSWKKTREREKLRLPFWLIYSKEKTARQ